MRYSEIFENTNNSSFIKNIMDSYNLHIEEYSKKILKNKTISKDNFFKFILNETKHYLTIELKKYIRQKFMNKSESVLRINSSSFIVDNISINLNYDNREHGDFIMKRNNNFLFMIINIYIIGHRWKNICDQIYDEISMYEQDETNIIDHLIYEFLDALSHELTHMEQHIKAKNNTEYNPNKSNLYINNKTLLKKLDKEDQTPENKFLKYVLQDKEFDAHISGAVAKLVKNYTENSNWHKFKTIDAWNADIDKLLNDLNTGKIDHYIMNFYIINEIKKYGNKKDFDRIKNKFFKYLYKIIGSYKK